MVWLFLESGYIRLTPIGDKVRDLLVRSKLPGNDLSQIWFDSQMSVSLPLMWI